MTEPAAAAAPAVPAAATAPAPAPAPAHAPAHGYAQDRDALVKRLHRIEGQVRGIERMLEDGRYCIDILTQVSAVTTALESVALKILDDHVRHCVAEALASGDAADAARKTEELLAAVQRFTRSR